jgi:hypothetical protein
MRVVTLNQFKICETNDSVSHIQINCKHWNLENESCKPFCKLKNTNVNFPTCRGCQERDPIVDPFQNKNDNTHPFVKQMREKLPQHNAYKVVNEEKQNSEEEKSFTEKAMSYGAAETSQILQGKVSNEVFEKRKKICMSCEFRVPEAKKIKDEIGWCKGGCGCTVGNPRAALSQKLYMPTLSCPKKKFGPEKGEGFNINDAKDSVKGIITSVKNLFEKDK